MSNVSKKMLMAAAGAAGGDKLTIDQVFSTFLYTGNGTNNHEIVTGIDMTEGGLVWSKDRNQAYNHTLVDSVFVTPSNKFLSSNLTDAYQGPVINSFTTTGYKLHSNYYANENTKNYVSWSFRKADKFFLPTTVSHSNGSSTTVDLSSLGAVGWVTVKRTDDVSDWYVWHRSLTTGNNIKLNSTAAQTTSNAYLSVSGTTLTISSSTPTGSYVIYGWADNSSEDAADQMIKCGSYSGTGSNQNINLGWPAQWILIKPTVNSNNWTIFDQMRGLPVEGLDGSARLRPNTSESESTLGPAYGLSYHSTGFTAKGGGADYNQVGNTYIYMAIRNDMMAEPTDATKVFDVALRSATSAYSVGFPTDLWIGKETTRANGSFVSDRLRGGTKYLLTPTTGAEQTDGGGIAVFDLQDSFSQGAASQPLVNWNWKRAKGYFDVVAYTGTGSARTIAHGLGAAPEMIWVKKRNATSNWMVYHSGAHSSEPASYSLYLNETVAIQDRNDWNNTAPNDNVFSLGTSGNVNSSGSPFISYLFSTLAGVSKVSSVVHSGTTNVDAGFTNGSRFVLLKRTDGTGDWLTYDSTRGIVSGNDPYLLLNSTAAEVTNTDYIDPYSAGFTLTSSLTAGTYIYYAVA